MAKFDADSWLYPVICNVMPTQCTCLFNCIYHPLQTSTAKSSLVMHPHSSHSPWLLGYIDVTQTFLFTLTMTRLFSGQTICVCMCVHTHTYMCIYMYVCIHTCKFFVNWVVWVLYTRTHIYKIKHYSDMRKNETLPLKIEGIMLIEINQTEKEKYCMKSLIRAI